MNLVSRRWNDTRPGAISLAHKGVRPKRLGKQVLERGRDRAGAVADTEYLGVGTELVEDLAAGTAGRGRCLGWRIDQGSPDPKRDDGSGDRLKDGGALGTDGQTVGGILDVAAAEDLTAVRQDRRADGELAVGTIGTATRFTGRDEQGPSFPIVNHGWTDLYPRQAVSGGVKTTIVRARKLFDAEPCTELSESLAVLPLRLETLKNRNQQGHNLVVGYVVLEFDVEPVANRAPTQEDRVGSGSGLAVGSDVGRAADQADVGVVRTSTAVGAAGHPDGQTFLGKSQPGELGFEVVENRGQGTFRLGDSQSARGQGGAGHRPAADFRDPLDRGDAVLFQPGVDFLTPGGVKVGQQDRLLAGEPGRDPVAIEEGTQPAEEPERAFVLDPAILDRYPQEELAVALLVPAHVVIDVGHDDRPRLGQRVAQVLLDLGPKRGHTPVVDDVLEPGPLAVRAVAEIAKDLEHGLADRERLLTIDIAERDGQKRERLVGARGGAQAAAHKHVVADDPAVLDNRQETQVVGMNVCAVIVRKGEGCLELARQVRLAVKRLDRVIGRGRHLGRTRRRQGLDLFAVKPDLPVARGPGRGVCGPAASVVLKLVSECVVDGRGAAQDVALHVAAGCQGDRKSTRLNS